MSASLAERIRAQAREVGFARCGFATVQPTPGADAFGAWLAAGYAGEMGWLERTAAKRADPTRVVGGARTVIALLATYHHPVPEPAPGARRGVVARYARGRDYHRVLEARLRTLTRWLDAQTAHHATDHAFRWYVDTGPVLEKPWAAAAGLGWTGKHTNLVSRTLGSWTFCAEILTTLDIPPDPPHVDHCGSCTRCIAACPTDAIVAPYRLDARLCISYLTIELRGPIPRHLRSAIGDRVYGCDDCLAVCPWNRFAEAAHAAGERDPDLAPRPGQSYPALVALLQLSEAEYAARFHGTALTRARRSGLRRNAAVALGNVGGPEAVAPLVGALHDDDPLVRGHAAWALGAIGGADAASALTDRAAVEDDAWVNDEIADALAT